MSHAPSVTPIRLAVTMVRASLRTRLVTARCLPELLRARRVPTRLRTILISAIAPAAEMEDRPALITRDLPQALVVVRVLSSSQGA
jgi:hypothetical protein